MAGLFSIHSLLWLLLCVGIGLLYAWVMYVFQKRPVQKVRYILFVCRTIAVGLIAYLLFAPLIKITGHTKEKPLIVIAQDNSASITAAPARNFDAKAYEQQLKQLASRLSEEYEVRQLHFGDKVGAGFDFANTGKYTDGSALFHYLNEELLNRNVGAVVMATDGIFNRGESPLATAKNLKAPIYTIALGDTIPKRDVLIGNVNYNKIVYLHNDMMVEVMVEAYLANKERTVLTVSGPEGKVFSKEININANEFKQTIPVKLSANKVGMQRYTLSLSGVNNEVSKQNNTQTIVIEVLDGRQKVLILADGPHPDISTIRQAIEINKNYEVKVAYTKEFDPNTLVKYDLVVIYQPPGVVALAVPLANALIKAAKPSLYVVGAQTDLAQFNALQQAVSITGYGQGMQEATAAVAPAFSLFTLSDSTRNRLSTFAPLMVPFGNYSVKGVSSVLLNQKVGRLATKMPLLLFANEGQHKTGVLFGEGIWRWQLSEFRDYGGHMAVNELLNKTVQYLSAKEDKRKFRVYPAKNTFDEHENVLINAELYNDAYELVNTPDAELIVKNKEGKAFKYLFTRTANAYLLDAGTLPPSDYTFTAQTKLGKNNEQAQGSFMITQLNTEFRQTTADHQLLYALSKGSGGKLFMPDQINKIVDELHKNEQIKTISYENRKYEELISMKWLFIVILALLSTEWFIRKRNGDV